jgi:hypothetical protein
VFHKVLLQDGTKIVTLCGATIFAPAAQKKLTKHDIRRLIGILRSGWEGRKFSWGKLAKKLVFMYLPKRLNEHLIGWDIIGEGLQKAIYQ